MKNIVLLITLLLTGCASSHLPIHIPIPVQAPKPQIPEMPSLPIYELKKGSAPDEVAKAYAASVNALLADDLALREILKSY